MGKTKTEFERNFVNWLAGIGTVFGFFAALISFIINFRKWAQDPQTFQSISIAGFILYFLGNLWFAFKAKNVKQAWRWTSLVALYVSTAFYFLWVGTWDSPPEGTGPTCADYGIKITSPRQGEDVKEEVFEVSGSYTSKPPEERVLLLYVSPDGLSYWPQGIVQIDSGQKAWRRTFIMAGDPPQKADIVVAVMGKSGRVLFDYFMKVGEETGKWPSIEKLTEDIVECDRISVIRTK